MTGNACMGEAAKASLPVVVSFAVSWWRLGLLGVAAQRCPHVSVLDAGEVHAPSPLPLALKSGFRPSPEPLLTPSLLPLPAGCPLLALGASAAAASKAQRRRGVAAAAGRAQRGLDLFLGQNRTHRGNGDA